MPLTHQLTKRGGLERRGRLVGNKYHMIWAPVRVTAGIGMLIAVGQLGNALGLAAKPGVDTALAQLAALPGRLVEANPAAMLLAGGVMLIMGILPYLNRSLPPAIVALVGLSAAAGLLGLEVPRIGAPAQRPCSSQ